MIFILFFIGFILLIKGADILVDGSTTIAKRFGISDIIIGLTIVAFGTSMPELIVNILASTSGAGGISIGNVIGSNIANILLILGISAIISTIVVQKNTIWKEIPFSLFAALLLLILASDNFFNQKSAGLITKADGIILILFFIVFLYYTFSLAKKSRNILNLPPHKTPLLKPVLLIIAGITALFFGGKWVVEGAIVIAKMFNVSETVIGVSIVAVGTSLPELVTSVIAALKKKSDIAVGNIVGSNIFNILWVLGVTSIISPITIDKSSYIDFYMLIFASLLLFGFLFIGNPDKKTKIINRWQGIVFVVIYVGYILFRFL